VVLGEVDRGIDEAHPLGDRHEPVVAARVDPVEAVRQVLRIGDLDDRQRRIGADPQHGLVLEEGVEPGVGKPEVHDLRPQRSLELFRKRHLDEPPEGFAPADDDDVVSPEPLPGAAKRKPRRPVTTQAIVERTPDRFGIGHMEIKTVGVVGAGRWATASPMSSRWRATTCC
jgi:hypothetical protein